MNKAQPLDRFSDYRHYKTGDTYKILALAYDSGGVEFVLYCAGKHWLSIKPDLSHFDAVDVTGDKPRTYHIVSYSRDGAIIERKHKRIADPILFLRTRDNFFAEVEVKGEKKPRFEPLPPF